MLSETIQGSGYKLISDLNTGWDIVASSGIPVSDHLSPNCVASVNLISFVCMYPGLFPYLPVLLREKVVGEKHINVMEGEEVRLGTILEFF